MAIKKSVRLTDETCELLHKLTLADETNWSGSINSMAAQYQLFIDDNTPELPENEWNALYCCFNGYMPHPEICQEIALLPWHVDQGYQYEEQVRQFLGSGETAKELIKKLENMTTSQKLAVIFEARGFWRSSKKQRNP